MRWSLPIVLSVPLIMSAAAAHGGEDWLDDANAPNNNIRGALRTTERAMRGSNFGTGGSKSKSKSKSKSADNALPDPTKYISATSDPISGSYIVAYKDTMDMASDEMDAMSEDLCKKKKWQDDEHLPQGT